MFWVLANMDTNKVSNLFRKICDGLKAEDRVVIELAFGNTPDKLKREYLDMYGRVNSEVLCATSFDENTDLSRTYLGGIDMTRLDKRCRGHCC